MKDDRDDRDRRENGTNGDDRKGELISSGIMDVRLLKIHHVVALDSPPPAHEELDAVE